MEQDVKFIIWDDGDNSVGIPGAQAEVAMMADTRDQEYMSMVKDTLREAFRAIWDMGVVHVMTEQEYQKWCESETE